MGLPVVLLASPQDGGISASKVVFFDAYYSDPATALPATMLFEFDTAATFDSPSLETVQYVNQASGTTPRSIKTLPLGTWYWRVTATNSDGTSASPVQSVVIAAIAFSPLYLYNNVSILGPNWSQSRALSSYSNIEKFVIPSGHRTQYAVTNIHKRWPDWTNQRTLYQYENITDDPPFPFIERLSAYRGPSGSIITIEGSGFGHNGIIVDLENESRLLKSYGGYVYIDDMQCGILEWSWTSIKVQIPQGSESGGIRVQLTQPNVVDSNIFGFEVYEGLPTEDTGIELFVCSREAPNVAVAQLTGAWNKSFQVLRNNPGSGSFKISRYDLVGGDQNLLRDDNLILVKLDGNPLFKWIIESKSPSYVDNSEKQEISVSGKGVLEMLRWCVVYPASMDEITLDRQFTGTPSSVLRMLLLEAKARGGLQGVSIDWDDDRDSIGNTFVEEVNMTFHVGTPLLEIASKFSDGLGYFDIEMTPNLVLKIYKQRGVDLSGQVIYRPGQAIMNHQNQRDSSKIVNEVLIEGKDKRLAIATNPDSLYSYGRREGYLSANNISSGLGEYGYAYLKRAAYPMWGIQGRVTQFYDEAGRRLKPFESYIIGDWIGWNIPPEGSDTAGFREVLRVTGITVNEDDETGYLDYTLELHSTMLDHDIRLNQKVERMAQYSGSDVLSTPSSSSQGYSESEVNELLGNKANSIHEHLFTDLADVPESYVAQGGKGLCVKSDGTGLEFYEKDGLPIVVVAASKAISPTDVATLQRCDSTAAMTITIPGTETIKIGAEIVFVRYGASNVNFAVEAGRNLYSISSFRFISGMYGAVTLKKMTADTWLLIGSLSEGGL